MITELKEIGEWLLDAMERQGARIPVSVSSENSVKLCFRIGTTEASVVLTMGWEDEPKTS